jgi:hypothetical protein
MIPVQMKDTPHVCQFQEGSHDKNDSDNFSSVHDFIVFAALTGRVFLRFDDAKLRPLSLLSKYLGYSA